MATKSVYIGPQDGWKKVITAGASFSTRLSCVPHTHQFYVFGDPTATPTVADIGVLVCHKPFKVENSVTGGNKDAFWIRVPGPVSGSKNNDGKARIDIYTDGGTIT